MILKSQKSFRSMRNPVRPPVGFFNRRLSTRQNSNSDKVSRHFHFLHLLWLSLSRWFASFLLSLSLSESSNAKPKRKHHRCGVTHRVRCWEGRGNSGLFKLLPQIIILKNIFRDVFQNQLKGTSFFQTPDEGSIPPSIVVSQPPS